MREDRIVLMCPKCGEYEFPLRNEHKYDICEFCGEKRIEIDLDYEVFDDCPVHFYKGEDFLEEVLYQKFLYDNPKFNKETFDERIKEEEKEWLELMEKLDQTDTQSYVNNNPRCPKCGSTAIQAVPRKWGLFAGIFTNKVDRVCLNCKNKF